MPGRARPRGAIVLIAMLVGLASCTDQPSGASPSPTTTPAPRTLPPDAKAFVGSPAPSGPSQSDADARRDHVPPAVAEQPLAQRIRTAWASAESDEGTWVAVRGSYLDYGEILLMDPGRSRVRRAFPLDGVPPQYVVLTDHAVFCARQGDGALPHSMVCRIDPKTSEMSVRVFASPGSPGGEPGFGDTWRDAPDDWTLDDNVLEVYEFAADDAGVWAKHDGDTWTRLDPDTLEVVDQDIERVTTDP